MEYLDETEKQLSIIEELSRRLKAEEEKTGVKKTFHVVTFGCQMNARDSEKLAGILRRIGYVETDTEDADFVIYNTCTVRENADLRVYGRLGQMKRVKEKHPGMLIALCGCMMQEPAAVEKIRKSYRNVDIIFGTHNIFKLAQLIQERLDTGEMVVDIWPDTDMIVENLPSERKYPFKCGVNIMFGCNNFCSYCIVPYVRGRERSRRPEDILSEIRADVADGVVEVMLLGQNVNSYGKNLETPVSFAQLLRQVSEIDGLQRIRFMTSHPKDLSDELIAVMADADNICRHIHLPVQSGSNRILKAMNRHYTREDYLRLVDKLRKAMPDIAITTDIIVGYPEETEQDFQDTLDLVKEVGYDGAFTFIYSKRTGTPAAKIPYNISKEEIKDRFDRLLAQVQCDSKKALEKRLGTVQSVLVESPNDHDPSMVTGRLESNAIVHFPGSADLIGRIVQVKMTENRSFYYIGERVSV